MESSHLQHNSLIIIAPRYVFSNHVLFSNIVVLYCEDPDGFHRLNLVWDISKPVPPEIKEFQLWEPKNKKKKLNLKPTRYVVATWSMSACARKKTALPLLLLLLKTHALPPEAQSVPSWTGDGGGRRGRGPGGWGGGLLRRGGGRRGGRGEQVGRRGRRG